jgi:signal transduction histidine kinase
VSIRSKVILPYLVLTLLVAVTGAYTVTRLVADSLVERLTNQLLEAGRVVNSDFVNLEVRQVDIARLFAFTQGLPESLVDEQQDTLESLVTPLAGGSGIENVILVNMGGEEIFHTQIGPDGTTFIDVTAPRVPVDLPMIDVLIRNNDPAQLPQRELARDRNNRIYYFTGLPVSLNDEMIGVVVVGTSIETLMPPLKTTSLADVVVYGQDGYAIGSTIAATDKEVLNQVISITPETYQELVGSEELVLGENISVDGREYSIARGRLQVGNATLGVFAVVLPSKFIIQAGADSRNLYVAIFMAAMVVVILIGVVVARVITNPLQSLVTTSQAISQGDLSRRTGIQNRDEIGVLAKSFDHMTENLEQRTLELERTNRVLEQMDRAKGSFIHISAHELRTPMTLIQGYSQLLEQKAGSDSSLEALSKGIAEGTARMTGIINSMLDVSRIDNQALRISLEGLKLKFVIDKVIVEFEEALQERQITLTTEGIEDLPLIPADAELIYKVFYQVIMNAIKYTPDEGSIRVSGRVTDEKEVEVSIRDTGIGIDPEYHELVFEKFYQTGEIMLHSSSKTKFKGGGPGLGLAIARGILKAHHGRIWLESPGYNEETCPGTTCYIRLPIDGNEHGE